MVTRRAFASNARCIVIMSENCWVRSTLDCSSVPDWIVPSPPPAGALRAAVSAPGAVPPAPVRLVYRLLPRLMSDAWFVKLSSRTWFVVAVVPSE